MSNYNSIYESMMANQIENFQQLDPNMMLTSISTPLSMPPMDDLEPVMTDDMMRNMVKEDFNDGEEIAQETNEEYETFEDEGDENGSEGSLSHDSECEDGNCENFEENFEDEIESGVEGFEETENKDMELWTCYPSNNENFENVEDNLFYNANGNATKTSNNRIINPDDKEMKQLYMYLAIAVIVLIIIYLLTSNK